MGEAKRSTPPPWVNGAMAKPYHTPVNCLQCLNDSPKQRRPQCIPVLFYRESECEWEASIICIHTKDHLVP